MKKPEKKKYLMPLLVIATLFAVILVTLTNLSTSKNKSTTTPTLLPASSTLPFVSNIDTKNYQEHHGRGFFKFSLKAPSNSYVCIGKTATGGNDNDCFPEGIYLNNMKDFPVGISFNQTTLQTINLQSLVENFGFQGYQPSDIHFDNAENQIMITGNETKTFYNKENKSITKEVNYIRYLFTQGKLIYMPTIYTDAVSTDLETYKTILSTWKFTASQ